jgi:uncharacterized membrane protein
MPQHQLHIGSVKKLTLARDMYRYHAMELAETADGGPEAQMPWLERVVYRGADRSANGTSRQVTSGYFRNHLYVTLGLTTLAALAAYGYSRSVACLAAAAQWADGDLSVEWVRLLVLAFAMYAVFTAYPIVVGSRARGERDPYLAAVLGSVMFFFAARAALVAGGFTWMVGALPVFEGAVMALLLRQLLQIEPTGQRDLGRLALVAGSALAFVTVAIPLQLERQWITIGWALEGVALLWLFHRVPHNGLRLAGVALLITSFVRLTFNPAVLHYHARAAGPIFNWYLYAYGITSACLFAGAQLLAPPRHLLLGSNARTMLSTLGTLLAFLLLNIEIADYFTEAGATVLTFEFSGNLACDMTYSIAWGAFALGLVIAGIWKKIRAARYAGVALLCATLLKLFFHDLARLQALYRIGALLGLAITAIAASFLYQRFFAIDANQTRHGVEPKPPSAST